MQKLRMLNEVKVYGTGLSFWSRFPLIDHSSLLLLVQSFQNLKDDDAESEQRFRMLKEAEHTCRFGLTVPQFFLTFKVIKLNSTNYHNA